MGQASMTVPSRVLSLSVLVLLSACLVSALVVENQEQLQPLSAVRRSMCQAFRRNCPAGFRKRLAPLEGSEESTEEAMSPSEKLMALSQLLATYKEKMADRGDYEYRAQPQLPLFLQPAILSALRERAASYRPRR